MSLVELVPDKHNDAINVSC